MAGSTGGKGGAVSPAAQTGMQPTGAPAAAQPNVFNQASQGLTSAMSGTAQGQGFYSPLYAGAYMNPYQQNVIGGLTQNAFGNYNQMANQLGAEATKAGAFGGSRHGVAQGAMAAGVQKDLNQQIGNLMYQGYGDALNRATADQQMRLGASAQQGNLANLGFGMGMQTQQSMAQQGALQQALQQAVMDKAQQQWQGWQQSPYTALSAMTSALGGSPTPTTQTTTQNNNRGLFDYLMLGASIYPKGGF